MVTNKEKLFKLGKKMTDRVPYNLGLEKLTEDCPEYWGLVNVLDDEMVDIALSMKQRVPMTLEEIAKAAGRSDTKALEDKLQEMTLPADMKTEVRPSAVAEKDYIMGQVIYIDSYGNAITNISRSLFDRVGAGRDFRIFLQGPYTRIEKISDSYGGVRPGQLLALFNSVNLLELAVFMGSLATLENIGIYDEIQIQFSKHG